MDFDLFVAQVGPRLRAGLVAAYGAEIGSEATAEALAYGWEHWDRLQAMANPAGYLYRVGQTAARRGRRPPVGMAVTTVSIPEIEPGLVPALRKLSESQRIVVLMVHAFGWSQRETADLLDVDVSTVRTHLARAMTRLRNLIGAEVEREQERA